MGKQVHRLEDLEVQEVSIVDRPANKRRFLAVKSEVGDMGDKGAEIITDENGNLVSDGNSSRTEETGDPTVTETATDDAPELGVFKSIEELTVKLEKQLSINPDMRREVFSSLGDSVGRLHTVMNTVDMAQVDRGDKPSTLTPVLAAELGEVAKAILSLAKLLGGPMKKDESDPSPDFKAFLDAFGGKLEELEKNDPETKGALETLTKALSSELDREGRKTTVKSEDPTKLEKAFVTLTERVTKLTGIVKAQNKKLHELGRVRGQSNVIPVEKGTPNKSEEDDTDWPLDMNNEKTRESVDKSVSFFD